MVIAPRDGPKIAIAGETMQPERVYFAADSDLMVLRPADDREEKRRRFTPDRRISPPKQRRPADGPVFYLGALQHDGGTPGTSLEANHTQADFEKILGGIW